MVEMGTPIFSVMAGHVNYFLLYSSSLRCKCCCCSVTCCYFSRDVFAMKVIWVGNKMAGVSDQFDPRAYHRVSMGVGGGGRRCLLGVNISFLHPHPTTKFIGFTWLKDGGRCVVSCSEHISDSFLHILFLKFLF